MCHCYGSLYGNVFRIFLILLPSSSSSFLVFQTLDTLRRWQRRAKQGGTLLIFVARRRLLSSRLHSPYLPYVLQRCLLERGFEEVGGRLACMAAGPEISITLTSPNPRLGSCSNWLISGNQSPRLHTTTPPLLQKIIKT